MDWKEMDLPNTPPNNPPTSLKLPTNIYQIRTDKLKATYYYY